ncbi:uncharacterized protein N7515_001540 [Penicillium bovifimosum]|uniref:Uncharacterized protein n=1 Tax=Penicillium bovifimosum TaxID=126998 RepID=A0A9W9HA54_9EURO|nr:uncharacterized protein N7515_001540 [Penicillium bovifimosum]KAJ5142753.1 hypothetical protein N7515_001540 [Penicillium bovifimosum]
MACPRCKAQKERCTHLNEPAAAPTPAAMPALPATPLRTPLSRKAKNTNAAAKEPSPVPDNEAAPSDAEKKGAAAATRRPRGTMEAACALSIHTTFIKEVQRTLDDFEEKVAATNEACVAMRASADAVQQTVDTWVTAWTARGQ